MKGIPNMTDTHKNDENGNPMGGCFTSRGVTIEWQKGPLGKTPEERENSRNGAFVEDILIAAKSRLEFYQRTPFACDENDEAIARIEEALEFLAQRTERREKAGIEGTHAEEPK